MRVPPLNIHLRITDEQGRPTPDFMQWWQSQLIANADIVPLVNAAQVSAVLDLLATGWGTLLFRGQTLWEGLPPGAAGYTLVTQGPDASPVWAPLAFTDLSDTPVSYTGQAGKLVVVNDTETALEFINSSQGGITILSEATAFSVDDTMLGGLYVVECAFAASGDITVPTGLTGTQPAEFVWVTGGRPMFTEDPGVSIISADGAKTLRTVGSWAKLTPRGSNSYLLWGDLTVGVGNGDILLLEGDFSGNLSLEGDAASGISYLVLEGV
jgi:hypothetical protein